MVAFASLVQLRNQIKNLKLSNKLHNNEEEGNERK